MLAYDWLKENPQQRDKLIKEGWAVLMTNDSVPYATKQELKDISKLTSNINDAVLFWHREFIYFIMNNTVRLKDNIPKPFWESKWAVKLYSAVQYFNFDKVVVNSVMHFILNLKVENCFLTFREVLKLVKKLIVSVTPTYYSMYTLIYYAITSNDNISASNADAMLTYCTPSLLRKINDKQEMHILSLIRDVDRSEGPFNSINAIQKAHDRRTEREIEKLINNIGSQRYIYHPEFVKIVEAHGFILPKGPENLILRGQQHNNCVGTYHNKHTAYAENCALKHNISRLLFSKTATMQIEFSYINKENECLIVCANIIQYKGRYNKDKEITDKEYELIFDLVGRKAKNILKVDIADV